ncbi:unnamed protein product [Vitrella brassicaformis CCMP3155]|uniref:Uncharacterized protein n=1 Tax=Vitrella brassicaformis (strain CCMP3155) TaxID=1169540 RepID=A0A0G4F2R4_VITBC|nr:unnamed protein product [Vitrella brassicaformis CCMP3155]|eukprot:CEM06508.1 unnamed protein product [Vitrella brassicaformis CCMP3155]
MASPSPNGKRCTSSRDHILHWQTSFPSWLASRALLGGAPIAHRREAANAPTEIMSGAADGAGGSIADESASSAASAAKGAASASSAKQQGGINAADVPQAVAPTVAEYVRSYSQLEALIDAHPTQFTAAVLLPILTQLLPVVVALIFGALVQVPLPQLTQGVAIIVAIARRLVMLERGGDWARWRPHLEMLYLLRGMRPVVLGDDNFGVFQYRYIGVFDRRAFFISETEAVWQWKILSWGVTVADGGQQTRLMDLSCIGDSIILLPHACRFTPTLLASASHLFPSDAFDPTDPPTQLAEYTYPNYTSMVAFVLFRWLFCGGHIRRVREWWSYRSAYAAFRRVDELLAASPSDAAQWGAGVAIFDGKRPDGKGLSHCRWVVLGSEVMGEGHMAVIELVDWWGYSRDVIIYSTEPAPHAQTRNVVMRMLGAQLGGVVWRGEHEARQATACTLM